VGLLTKIFGDIEDGASVSGEATDEHVVRPEGPAEPRGPGLDVSGGDVSAGSAGARSLGTALQVVVGEASKETLATLEADDPDEIDVTDDIDVSDEVVVTEALDASEDLDATEDLILEADDEEVTSPAVAATGADVASPSTSPGRVALLPLIHGRGSVARDPSDPDQEKMTMLSETKTVRQTLVEEGTEFKGVLKSSCPVVVNGTIDGEVDAPLLSIARTGSVLGVIRAKTLRSQGTLSGKVDAGDVFVSGAVRSKTFIKASRLEMKIGPSGDGQLEVTFGKCDIEVPDVVAEPETRALATTLR
jgi:cytoskeletal protein CcmA (bactofilin family)